MKSSRNRGLREYGAPSASGTEPAEKTLGANESSLTRAMRKAIGRIGSDGRLLASDARAIRRLSGGRPATECAALLAEPDGVLGTFESLSSNAQRAVIEAIAKDDRWRMAGHDLGRWHAALTRSFWLAQSKLSNLRVRETVELCATALQAGPMWGVYATYRKYLATLARVSPRPKLSNVLAETRVDVRKLAVSYASGVRQLPPYRGFWHEAASNTTVGLIVGIDLIENAEGYWFLEGNMDCGLRRERTALYETDPFVHNLLEFTEARGYRRLIVLASTASIEPEMARQYQEGAAARNLELRLLEDPRKPRYGHERSINVPGIGEPNTLLVRNRYFRTSLDYIVQHKRATSRALRMYQQESGNASFRLPEARNEPCLGSVAPAEPFPNVVFKFPERDLREGLFFMKAASPVHARKVLAEALRSAPPTSALSRVYSRLDDQGGFWQPYIKTPWLPDRRLYVTRGHVLLTPVAVHFLSAHRLVGVKPVPNALPMGMIRDPLPYALSPGAAFAVVPPEEMPAVRDAALGVARGLSWALSRGFQTGGEAGA